MTIKLPTILKYYIENIPLNLFNPGSYNVKISKNMISLINLSLKYCITD